MSAEAITKFEPHRTLYMRAFDRRGAAAAIHSASATCFTAIGVDRDFADFCVVVLLDADNGFEHPRLSTRRFPANLLRTSDQPRSTIRVHVLCAFCRNPMGHTGELPLAWNL